MAEQKETQAMEQSDFDLIYDRIYKVVENYVKYCIQSPTKKSTKEESASDGETDKKDEARISIREYEEQKKNSRKTFDIMCEFVSAQGITALSLYVDALKRLYEANSSWKKDIKSALTSSKSLKLFREARNNISDLYADFYNILLAVSKTFQVDEYAELSLTPKAALCGSEVNKTAQGSTKRVPIKNKEIQAMLEMFAQVKDFDRLGDWLMAILVFTPKQIIEGFEHEYAPMRKELKEWVYAQIESNDSYKSAVTLALQQNQKLRAFVDAYLAQETTKAERAEMEERIKKLEADNAREKADHEERREKQFEIIKEKDAMLEDLKQKVRNFDYCKQELSAYKEKYQTQIDMNERITAENKRRIQATEEEYDRMQDELSEKLEQAEGLQTECTALRSDICLKDNELQRLKEMVNQKEETARIDMMRELVTGIKEQFYYLTMFYLDLKETGKLDPESIELYADTINNIENVLANMGMKKIGVIDQQVAYDASIHEATDTGISNGEQVVVRGYGWKIGEDVYIKAPVEKGEE